MKSSFSFPSNPKRARNRARFRSRHVGQSGNEKFSFDLNTSVLKNFTVQGIQLLYRENNNSKFLTGHDWFAVGGQVSGKIDLGFMTSTPSFTLLNWRNEDAILSASAFAVQGTTTGTGTTNNGNFPGEGPGCATGSGLPAFPPCAYGPQGFTNATFTDAGGKIHRSAFTLFRLGIGFYECGRYAEAEDQMKKALELHPASVSLRMSSPYCIASKEGMKRPSTC
jgi:hypothetical protein